MSDSDKLGVAVRTDCWKYASRILSHKLVLNDFDVKKVVKDHYYMFSCLKLADFNRSRIKANILILDKHKPKSRPNPQQYLKLEHN